VPLGMLCAQSDGSQNQGSHTSTFLHDRISELEVAAERSKLKVKVTFLHFRNMKVTCQLILLLI